LRRDVELETLCEKFNEILRFLSMIGISREYLDKNLIPTSEGMKILRKTIRISKEYNLPCTEVLEKISEGYHYLANYYDCINDYLERCEKKSD